MRVAANLTFLFSEFDTVARPAAARDAGFDAVEIIHSEDVALEVLAAAVRAAGLPVAVCNCPVGDFVTGGSGLSGVPGREAAFDEAFDQALRIADAFGCGRINIGPSRLAPGEDREVCMEAFAHNVGKAAARFDGTLLVEPLNRTDFADVLLAGPEEGLAVVERVGRANVRLQFDAYHVAAMGFDPVAALVAAFDHVGHVQIGDVPGRGAPGTGRLDFDALFGVLDQGGYAGFVGAEYVASADGSTDLRWWRDRQIAAHGTRNCHA